MQLQDIEALKGIPGYTAIMKAVLKSQIQLLVEQLSSQTGEETIILTASINDGSLYHLGSERAKTFLDGQDELKSEFLTHCLKGQERPQSKKLTRRSQLSPAKKNPSTVTSLPTFTSEYQEQLFSPVVHLNPITGVSDAEKPESRVFKLNIPGDDLETVHVSVNDDVDDNDTDSFAFSLEQTDSSSQNTESKQPKRKHGKGRRKGFFEKKRKSTETKLEAMENSQIENETNKDEDEDLPEDLEIIRIEKGENSNWTDRLGTESQELNRIEETDNQSAINMSRSTSEYFNHTDVPDTSVRPSATTATDKSQDVITCPISPEQSCKTELTPTTGSQQYICQYCKRSFISKFNYGRHLLIHTDQRPFSCNICQLCFRQKTHLQKHVRTLHSAILTPSSATALSDSVLSGLRDLANIL